MRIKGNKAERERDKSNTTSLPLGATQESNLQKMTLPRVDALNQISIDPFKIATSNDNLTDEQIAQAFGITKDELIEKEIDGKDVILIPYGDQVQWEETLKKNPGIANYLSEQQQTNTGSSSDSKWVKIRQWHIDADITHVMLINDLVGWPGKIHSPREGQKYTTAAIKAPSEEEAARLLEKGYITNNGKLMAVVPDRSNQEQEAKRTVLLVGVNKLHEAIKKQGNILTELGLLKSLKRAGYPIQSLKLVEWVGNRISHSAYVLLKYPTPTENLAPFHDKSSEILLKWTNSANYEKICEKCLTWQEHDPTCNRHPSNIHRIINGREIEKRAAEGGSSLIMGKYKKQKEPP
jgi:hypothetical protein